MNIVCVRQHSGKNLEAVFWAFKLVQMFTEPRIFQNMPVSEAFPHKVYYLCTSIVGKNLETVFDIPFRCSQNLAFFSKYTGIWWFFPKVFFFVRQHSEELPWNRLWYPAPMFSKPHIFQIMPESDDFWWRDDGKIVRDWFRFAIFSKRTTQTHNQTPQTNTTFPNSKLSGILSKSAYQGRSFQIQNSWTEAICNRRLPTYVTSTSVKKSIYEEHRKIISLHLRVPA